MNIHKGCDTTIVAAARRDPDRFSVYSVRPTVPAWLAPNRPVPSNKTPPGPRSIAGNPIRRGVQMCGAGVERFASKPAVQRGSSRDWR